MITLICWQPSECCRVPRHRVKGFALVVTRCLSVPVCGIGTPQLRAPNYYEAGNPADVWSRILSQLSSDLVSEEVRLSSYCKALSPILCCLGTCRSQQVGAPSDARSVAATLQDGITLADDDLHNAPQNDYLKSLQGVGRSACS